MGHEFGSRRTRQAAPSAIDEEVLSQIGTRIMEEAELLPLSADQMEELMVFSYRQACRGVILLVGASVLVIGIAMIVLPGPAILVVPLGLAILASEFAWARRWLAAIRARLAAPDPD